MYLLIHYILIFFLLFLPFYLDKQKLKFYTLFLLGTIFHWYLNDGRCFLSQLHSNETNNEDFIIYLFNKHNIPNYLFTIIVLLLIIISFIRLNKIKMGIILIITLLILNYYFYGTILFK